MLQGQETILLLGIKSSPCIPKRHESPLRRPCNAGWIKGCELPALENAFLSLLYFYLGRSRSVRWTRLCFQIYQDPHKRALSGAAVTTSRPRFKSTVRNSRAPGASSGARNQTLGKLGKWASWASVPCHNWAGGRDNPKGWTLKL